MREILTLQFGSAANHVGAHFWNIQDEFRRPSAEAFRDSVDVFDSPLVQGRPPQVTPRALIYDVQTSFSSLVAQNNTIYALEEGNAGLWSGSVSTVRRPRQRESTFRDAFAAMRREEARHEGGRAGAAGTTDAASRPDDSAVDGWADYSLATFSERSFVHVDSAPPGAAVDSFSHGAERGEADEEDALTDPVRRAVEACDSLQALHLLLDVDTSASGVACHVATFLRDECGKVTTLHCPISLRDGPAAPAGELNRVLAASSLLASGVVLPLEAHALAAASPWRCDWSRPFHAALPLAHALDAVTSPYRAAAPARTEADGAALASHFWQPLASAVGADPVLAADLALPTAGDPDAAGDGWGRVSAAGLSRALGRGPPLWAPLLGGAPRERAADAQLRAPAVAAVVLRGAADRAAAVRAIHEHAARTWGLPAHRTLVWPHRTPLLVSPASPGVWPLSLPAAAARAPGAADGAGFPSACAAMVRVSPDRRAAGWCRARVAASTSADARRVLFHFRKAGLEDDTLAAAEEALLAAADAVDALDSGEGDA